MKNKSLFTILIFTGILFCSSLFYKTTKSHHFKNFPTKNELVKNKKYIYLYLYVFFSVKNCSPCLDALKQLNKLPPEFKIFGVIPDEELQSQKNIKKIKEQLLFKYPIIKNSKFKAFTPNYRPTVIACSSKGKIYFIFPITSNAKDYIVDFALSFYDKSFNLLLSDSNSQK